MDETSDGNPSHIKHLVEQAEQMLVKRSALAGVVSEMAAEFNPDTNQDPWVVVVRELASETPQTETMPLGAIYGYEAPEDCDALATMVFSPKRLSPTGETAKGWFATAVSRDGDVVRTKPETHEIDRTPEGARITPCEDPLLRAFGLPTLPAEISVGAFMTKMWLLLLAAQLSDQKKELGWEEAAMLHPAVVCFTGLEKQLGEDNHNMTTEGVARMIFAGENLVPWSAWREVMKTVASDEDAHPVEIVSLAKIAFWFDEGSFSRFADATLTISEGGPPRWIEDINSSWDDPNVEKLVEVLRLLSEADPANSFDEEWL